VEFQCPNDGVGALDFGSGEDIEKWCLMCYRVRQESPEIVQHAQETAELTCGFGRLAFLKVGHSFFQRLGALSRHLIIKENDFGYSEVALRRFDENPELL
jgi:hypothetical protein